MANVFVSHRGADTAIAERLAGDLRDRGHDVWLDVWKINVGDSIVERINSGLAGASFVVLCFSDAPSTSPWVDQEWMSALARQLDGAKVKVLPARIAKGTPPAILADIKYADLSANWQDGVTALCKALR
jgi:hypothetical protein